jgi:hypothetical protein
VAKEKPKRPAPPKAFKPGPDPRRNAGGRPKGLREYIRNQTGENGEKLYEILWDIAQGKMTVEKSVLPPKELRHLASEQDLGDWTEITEPTIRERMDAALALMAYGHGKPTEHVQLEASVTTTHKIDLATLTDEELEVLERVQVRALPAGEAIGTLPLSQEVLEAETVPEPSQEPSDV